MNHGGFAMETPEKAPLCESQITSQASQRRQGQAGKANSDDQMATIRSERNVNKLET